MKKLINLFLLFFKMECTKCRKRLDLSLFSYKNIEDKIYYLYCDNCREKINNDNKKIYDNISYLYVKNNNVVSCKCGKKYIAFRNYHIIRHENSKYHKENINS